MAGWVGDLIAAGIVVTTTTAALGANAASTLGLTPFETFADGGSLHFATMWGTLFRAHGTLVAIADTYPGLGREGRHPQPVDRLAAALARPVGGSRRSGAFGDATVAAAMLDRLLHRVTVASIDGIDGIDTVQQTCPARQTEFTGASPEAWTPFAMRQWQA